MCLRRTWIVLVDELAILGFHRSLSLHEMEEEEEEESSIATRTSAA